MPSRLVAAIAPLVLLVAACGERGELLGTKESSALVPPPPPPPSPLPPSPPAFGAPQLVASLSSSAIDEDPTFTADLLDLFFMSMRDGTKDIWTSHRATATESWGAPVRVAELSSPSDDWAPSVTPDGRTIYFATDRDSGHAQLWRASRATGDVAWAAPLAVPELASSAADTGPDVDVAERALYFSSNRGADTGIDIYLSTRGAVNAPWGAPVAVSDVNTADADFDPFIAADGRLLFLTRITSSNQGDIYWTARGSTTDPWSATVALTSVNSPSYDSDAALSSDLSYIMFSSMRTGNGDIYEAHALP